MHLDHQHLHGTVFGTPTLVSSTTWSCAWRCHHSRHFLGQPCPLDLRVGLLWFTIRLGAAGCLLYRGSQLQSSWHCHMNMIMIAMSRCWLAPIDPPFLQVSSVLQWHPIRRDLYIGSIHCTPSRRSGCIWKEDWPDGRTTGEDPFQLLWHVKDFRTSLEKHRMIILAWHCPPSCRLPKQ